MYMSITLNEFRVNFDALVTHFDFIDQDDIDGADVFLA